MGYSDRDTSFTDSVKEPERPISRRERISLFAASVVGGAFVGGSATLLVVEHLPIDISGTDLGYAVGAGAIAGATILGEEALRATRKGFNIQINNK